MVKNLLDVAFILVYGIHIEQNKLFGSDLQLEFVVISKKRLGEKFGENP